MMQIMFAGDNRGLMTVMLGSNVRLNPGPYCWLPVSVTVRRWSRIQDFRYCHIISDNSTDNDGEGCVGGAAAGDGAALPPRLRPAPPPPGLPAGA